VRRRPVRRRAHPACPPDRQADERDPAAAFLVKRTVPLIDPRRGPDDPSAAPPVSDQIMPIDLNRHTSKIGLSNLAAAIDAAGEVMPLFAHDAAWWRGHANRDWPLQAQVFRPDPERAGLRRYPDEAGWLAILCRAHRADPTEHAQIGMTISDGSFSRNITACRRDCSIGRKARSLRYISRSPSMRTRMGAFGHYGRED